MLNALGTLTGRDSKPVLQLLAFLCLASALPELLAADFPDKAGGAMLAIEGRIGAGLAGFYAIVTVSVLVLVAYDSGFDLRVEAAFSRVVVGQMKFLLT